MNNRFPLFKTLLTALVLTILFSGVCRMVSAEDFTADHDVSYTVLSGGMTMVSQKITLTNLQDSYYPRQYTLSVDADISDVTASDNKGTIEPTVVKMNGKTNISVKFHDHPVGIGKTLPFHLRYLSASNAKKIGNIWEVRIPALSDDEFTGEYTVHLAAAAEIGPLAYANPKPASGNLLTWTKDEIKKTGVIASFGTVQKYRLTIEYPIQNPTSDLMLSSITLPPTTAYQRVEVVSLDPKPEQMQADPDGNSIAKYKINPNDSLTVEGVFDVSISLPDHTKPVELDSLFSTYLTPQTYWESDFGQIQTLASSLQTPKDIYDYVVRTLSYDYQRAQGTPVRMGAKAALSSPSQAVCREFTDLFIALCRAAGIPAREIIGYAYTDDPKLRPLLADSDILHAWPEYFNPVTKTWVSVDPTWAKTTGGIDYFSFFDFRHIALAIHGISSTQPPSPGEYKPENAQGKSIHVEFLESKQPAQQELFTITFEFPPGVQAGRTYECVVKITNISPQNLEGIPVSIDAFPYVLHSSKTIDTIPPKQSVEIPVSIPIRGIFDSSPGRIRVIVNQTTMRELQFSVQPLYWYAVPVFFLLLGIFFLWMLSKKRSE